MKRIHLTRRLDQRGMTSLVVTMIIMAVLTLITVGFAQIMRREQRGALDRQLSSQAFYAAEAGVDDARYAISNGYTSQKTDCGDDGIGALMRSGTYNDFQNPALNVGYTCLLIDQQPPDVTITIGRDRAKVIPLRTVSGPDHIDISFTGRNGNTNNQNLGSTPGWPAQAAWGVTNTGVLRMDITRIPAGGLTPAVLDANTRTFFIFPSTGPTTVGNWGSPDGSIVIAGCPASGACSTSINGFGGSTTSFYIRMRAIYNEVDVTLAPKTSGGGTIRTIGTQAIVDSTGKAADVERRLQVRLPLSDTFVDEYPSSAVQSSGSMCKRLITGAGGSITIDPLFLSEPECDPRQ